MVFQRNSRIAGPLLVSVILCSVFVDYTFYKQTNSSLLAWFWTALAKLFGDFSVSKFFSRETLLLIATIVGFGIVLTRLSLRRALEAMSTDVSDETVTGPPLEKPATVTRGLDGKSLGSVFISYNRGDTSGFSHLLYERLNKRFPGRIVISKATGDGAHIQIAGDPVAGCDIVLAVLNHSQAAGTGEENSAINADQRNEIASALAAGRKIITVLPDDARMPTRDELPDDIGRVVESASARVSDQSIVPDIERLIERLEVELGENRPNPFEPLLNLFRPYWLYAGAIALAVFFILMRELGIIGF